MSTNVYSKLLFRALKLKDNKLFQTLVGDLDKAFSVGNNVYFTFVVFLE